MKAGWFFPLKLLVVLFCLLLCTAIRPALPTDKGLSKESAATPPYILSKIQVAEADGQADITLEGIPFLKYLSFKTGDPLRLVIVLPDIVGDTVQTPLVVENDYIDKIETIMPANNPFPLTRVEIGLKLNVSYEIRSVKGGIRIRLQKPDPATNEASNHAGAFDESEIEIHQQKVILEENVASRQSEEATASAPDPDKENALLPAGKIIAITKIIHDKEIIIQIIADGSLANYNTFHLTNPGRFVIDLMGVRSSEVKSELSLNVDMIKNIRIGHHTDKLRVVFDLVSVTDLNYNVVSDTNRLRVSFKTGASFSDKKN